jgi:hypothetical protein
LTIDLAIVDQGEYWKIHEELNDVISTFDQQIDYMMGKHEKDFMTAYKVCNDYYVIIHTSHRTKCLEYRKN